MEKNLLAELHSLPDEALLTADEAAQFLRLKYTTLAWYRCQRVGPKLIRYRVGDLREYASGHAMGDGVHRAAQAALAGRRRAASLRLKSEG